MASETQLSHGIPQSVYNEFKDLFRDLGFLDPRTEFGIGKNGVSGPNVTPLPKDGVIGGPSGHNGFDDAHRSANQAIREYLDNVRRQFGNTQDVAQGRSQIEALREGLTQAAKDGELALSKTDQKFKTLSAEQLLQKNRDVVAGIAKGQGVVPNANLPPLPKSGALVNAFNKLGVVGAVIGTGITAAQAGSQFGSGDTRGGAKTITGFLGGLVGGIVAGAAVGTLAAGPFGTIAGAAIGLGAGILGGLAGEKLANSGFDKAWPAPPGSGDQPAAPGPFDSGAGQSTGSDPNDLTPAFPPPTPNSPYDDPNALTPAFPPDAPSGNSTNNDGGVWGTAQQYIKGQLGDTRPPDEYSMPGQFPENGTEPIKYLDGTNGLKNDKQSDASDPLDALNAYRDTFASATDGGSFQDSVQQAADNIDSVNQVIADTWLGNNTSQADAPQNTSDAYQNFLNANASMDADQGATRSIANDQASASTNLTFDGDDGNRVSDSTTWQSEANGLGDWTDSWDGGSGGWTGGWSGGSGWTGGWTGWTGGWTGWTGGWTGWTGGWSGGWSGGWPVVLDLNGDGIKITPRAASNQYFDMAGDGYQHATAWAGAGDGILVLDHNGDGVINETNEVDFTLWDPTATSDMQALLDVFDTNHNGKLDSGDADWSKFKVLVTNPDGTTTLQTLAQLGITSINLTTNNQSVTLPDGSSIKGQTTYTRTDGTTGLAADVVFAYDVNGYVVQTTTTHNADGSTTIENKAFNTDGSVARDTISKTSADGKTVTISRDTNGDGVIDSIETDVTVQNADSSTTLTVTNFEGSGSRILNRTVTTTSGDLKSVTINRDSTGSGFFDQVETRVTDAAGNLTITVTDYNPDGSLKDRGITTTSASGLSRTAQIDVNGDGVVDLTQTDVTVVNADGGRTETVSDFNTDGSLRDRTVTLTSVDHLTKTSQIDSNGDGAVDLTRVASIVIGADGSSLTTQQEFNGDGSLRDKIVTALSADGLSKTTQVDLDGNGTFDLTTTDVTVRNADGSVTETVTDRNADGSLLDRSVTTRSLDGRTRTIQIDANGDGNVDSLETVAFAANGSSVDTVSVFNNDGSLNLKTITTTSADGRSRTIQFDIDGNGSIDRTLSETTVVNAGGGSTTTQTALNADGSLHDKTVVTTSADGLSTTTQWDTTGAGSFNVSETDVTVVNADGSRTETVSDFNANGSLRGRSVSTLSADRRTTSVQIDSNGDGHVDQTRTSVVNANGSIVQTVSDFNADGTLNDKVVTTTSANGLSVTTQVDDTGSGSFNRTRTDVTALNADGSRTETITDLNANGSTKARKVITVSATGLSKTTQTDADGNGTFDLTTTDVAVLNANGSVTETVSDYNADGTLRGRVVTTASATELDSTLQVDANGDGVFETVQTDHIVYNANGSVTETLTTTNANGSLRNRTVATTSADGNTVTASSDVNGDGVVDQTETTVLNANGSKTTTRSDYNANGSLKDSLIVTVSANGMSTTVQCDSDGNGSVDQTRTDVIVLNANGSSTETFTTLNANGSLRDNVVVTVSADGLSKTTQWDATGSGSYNLTETDVIVLGADGSRSETVTHLNGNGSLKDKTVSSVSADQKTVSRQVDLNGDGVFDQVLTTTLNSNGSVVETRSDYNANSTLKDRLVTTTSANGLSVTVQSDADGNGTVDQTRTDITVLNGDGSRTETISDLNANLSLRDKIVSTVSADGRSKSTQWDVNGDGVNDSSRTDVTVLNSNGSTTESISNFNANGSLKSRYVETISDDGLSKTKQWDTAGSGAFDQSATDIVVLNADGSTTETLSAYNANGSLKSRSTITTSADGRSQSTVSDLNGDGAVDQSKTITTIANADGSRQTTVANISSNGSDRTVTTTSYDGRTVTVSRDADGNGTVDQIQTTTSRVDGTTVSIIDNFLQNGSLADRATVTTSSDGLTKTTQWDLDANGSIDRTRSDIIVSNLDGSQTETVIDTNSNGTLHQKGVLTTSADGRTTTLLKDTTGKGYYDHTETTTTYVDGSSTTVTTNVKADGSLIDRSVTAVSADGLTRTIQTDTDGNGTFDYQETTTTNIDGSTVASGKHLNADGSVKDRVVTTVSADGLSKTIQTDSTNAGWFDSVETIVTRVDGSIISTTREFSSTGAVTKKTVTETSASGEDKVSNTINFVDGTSTIGAWDLSNSQSWSFLSNTYDGNGNLLSQWGTYDNGMSWRTDYDVAGTETWSFRSQDHDASGQLLSGYVLNDDGTYSRHYFDTTGTRNWTSVTNEYSAQGVLLKQYGRFRDNATTNVPAIQAQFPTFSISGPAYSFNYGHGSTWVNTYGAYYPTTNSFYHFGYIFFADDATFGYEGIQGNLWQSDPYQGPGFGQISPLPSNGGGLWAGYFSYDGFSDELGSIFDYQLGIVHKASDWEFLPTNVALPVGNLGLTDLINKVASTATKPDAGDGNDTVVGTSLDDFLIGLGGDDVLYGYAGADVLQGGTGNDTLYGGDGNDALHGGAGADTIDGGAGSDTAIFTGARSDYLVSYNTSNQTYTVIDKRTGSPDGTDTIAGVESFQFADQTVAAANVASLIVGSPSRAETLYGDSGANTLDGAGGGDTLLGAGGNDTYVFGRGYGFATVFDDVQQTSTSTTASTVVTTTTTVTPTTSYTYTTTPTYGTTAKGAQYQTGTITTTQSQVYNVTTTNIVSTPTTVTTTMTTHLDGGSDTLSFKSGIKVSDVMMQVSGNNLVVGLADPSNPTATFAQLTDKITLQSWFDALDRIETFTFADGTTINVANMAFQTGGAGTNTLVGTAASNWLAGGAGGGTLTGGSGIDVLIGGAAATTLIGGGGNDMLYGGTGGGQLQGGAGNDALVGGAATDTAVFSGARANYLITYNSATQTYTVVDQRSGSPDGTDTVSGVEFFQFSDITLDAANVVSGIADATLSGGSIAENPANGSVVGTVAAVVAGGTNVLQYTLTDSAGGRFAIDTNTGVITVANGAALDYEASSSQHIVVRISNQFGQVFDKAFDIAISNVNEAPTGASLSANKVEEGAANGTIIGTVAGADPDAGGALSYSLVSNANGRFAINATTGQLSLADRSQLDHVNSPTVNIIVRVADQGGLTFDKTFTIQVLEPNLAPTDIQLSATTVAENVAPGTAVATLSATDPNAGDTFTYTIVGGASDKFAISGNQLVVKSGAVIDFETTPTLSVTIRVADHDGVGFDKTFTIAVTNVNEAPANATLGGGTVAENAANGTVVGTVAGTDPDAGSVLTYSLVNNAGGRFAINANTGVITVANGSLLDYETAPSQTIVVRVTDQGGLTFDKTFAIAVTNVNEAPTAAALTSGGSIYDNAVNGTVVGTVTGTDPDTGSVVSYALTNSAGGLFAINATTGVITIANASLLTPGASSPQVTVRVTDQGGLTFDQVLTLTVLPAIISGTSGNDTLTGGSTPTTLIGLGGNNTLIAGSGGATAGYTGAPAKVVVNLAAGTAQNGYGGTDTLVGIHNALGSAYADTLTGDSGANTLDGAGGGDTLLGGAGNDIYVFGCGYGFETVFDDVQEITYSTTISNVALTTTTVTPTTSYTYTTTPTYGTTAKGAQYQTGTITTTQSQVYNVTTTNVTTSQALVVTTMTTHLDGGSDTLSFKAGIKVADVMAQAAGNNLVVALANPSNPSATFAQLTDKITLTNWFDPLDRIETFVFADGTTINVANMAFQTGGAGTNTLVGIATSNWLAGGAGGGTLTGGSGVDVLIGGAAATTLIGGTGNDMLYGGTGGGQLQGGAGNDTLVGGAGTDTAVFSGARANYLVTYNAATQTYTVVDQRAGSPDGTDTVSGVEFFQFADITVNAAAAAASSAGVTLSGGTIAENSVNGSLVGTIAGTLSGGTLTYSLIDNAGGRFAIDANTGVIAVNNGSLLNYEAATSQTIMVRVADQNGLTLDKTFTIGLTNVNEAPTAAALASGSVYDNATNGTVVGTVTGTDPDAGSVLSYALTNSAGGLFAINATTGVITIANASLLTPGASSPQVTVRVTDQGGLTFDQVLTLSILSSTITGTSGNDSLTGGSTPTTLIGLGGNNTLTAGSGGATAGYTGAPAKVVVNLAAGTAQNGYGGTDTLVGIHNALGSAYADTLTGNSGANTLDGAGGGDTLLGGAGNDVYVFGRGYGFATVFDDVQQVSTSTTTSTVVTTTTTVTPTTSYTYTTTPTYGTTAKGAQYQTGTITTTQSQVYNVTTTNVVSTPTTVTTTMTTHLDGGSDTLSFKAGIKVADVMMQASGNNLVVALANPSNPSATFAQLTDKITLQSWFDTLDRIETFAFADGTTINVANMAFQTGGSGTNTLVGTAASNWLAGGAGGGTLTGGSGVDVLIGGAAATTLIGGGGNNVLNAGTGVTVANYSLAPAAATVNLATGTAQNGYGGTDTLIGIHSVLAGSNAILIAGTGADTLTVTGTHNTLTGGSGASTLVSSGSGNTLIAGSGNDTLTNQGTAGFYDVNLGAGETKIINGLATNTQASNELDFGAGITKSNLWFIQSGNDLQIDVMGTTETVTIANWFAGAGNQLQEISAGGLKLDSQVSQLVQAMATYTAGHAGFDPTTVTQAPNDTSLQSAITGAWHT
jgi:Ca2+-binding RTX toxin-like protein